MVKDKTIYIPFSSPIVLCFGGGVDSTAMLVALERQRIRPDMITFADVGGEKPDTYEHVRYMEVWLKQVGFPPVTWCKKIPTDRVKYTNLEGNCVENETLPSLAFGMKSCSIKWKHVPQDYALKGCCRGPNACEPHPIWVNAQKRGVKPIKLIGYDAGPADLRRSKNLKVQDDDFKYVYPLQQLGWGRQDCVKAIIETGLRVPIKSACFFCPASKKWELYWLAGHHPDLFERALVMEYTALTGHHSRYDEIEFGASWEDMVNNADRFPSSNTTVGLGRSFAWNQWARVNKVTDNNGKVIMKPEVAKAHAARLNAEDNALDGRSC